MNSSTTTYRRLGDYIRQVDVRNRGLKVTNLKGLSNEKVFIESIANTIGTDFSGYKIILPNQFAYVPVTSRNGDKITIAYYEAKEAAIVSQAYTVFEVTDENALLPEYLMMWVRRPEFDRYSRFKSHGSAREIFDWNEMCDVMLPVPPIEEQREIVARHKAIEHKIDVNRRLIAKLEETARTIYRHTFVENIDPENLPDGWRMGTLEDLGEIVGGATPKTEIKEYWSDSQITWLSPADLSKDRTIFTSKSVSHISQLGYNSCSTKLMPIGSVLFSSRAPIGLISILNVEACTNQGFKSVVPYEKIKFPYVYFFLKDAAPIMDSENTGSTFNEVSTSYMKNYPTLIPEAKVIEKFNSLAMPIFDTIKKLEQENALIMNLL